MTYGMQPCLPGWKLLLPAGAVPTPGARQAFEAYEEKKAFGAVELRAWPCDTPRHFGPVGQEGRAVGGPVAVREEVFQALGGLCRALPDEAAMQDLSARLRAAGVKMGYCPSAVVECPVPQDSLDAYCRKMAGEYLLRMRWGNAAQRRAAWGGYLRVLRAPRHFAGVRRALLRQAPGMLWKGLFLRRQKTGVPLEDVLADRCARGQYVLRPLAAQPLVSIVVRTHARPQVLARTLQCLRWQTYRRFEVVVVEDGPALAEHTVRRGFPELDIRYIATGAHVGRGRAGNIGIENSRGEYVCFLDDDDYYYPDYLETSVCAMQQGDVDMVLSSSMVFKVDVHSTEPYRFTVKQEPQPVVFGHINLLDMCVKCRIPLLAGMFRRSLYEKAGGGMREDLDGDEDWAMWLRFWRVAKRADDTKPDITRTLSLFGIPAGEKQAEERLAAYAVCDSKMLADETLCYTIEKQKFSALHRQLLQDIAHLAALGRLKEECAAAAGREEWCIPRDAAWPLQVTAKELNGYYYGMLRRAGRMEKEGVLQKWLENAEF